MEKYIGSRERGSISNPTMEVDVLVSPHPLCRILSPYTVSTILLLFPPLPSRRRLALATCPARRPHPPWIHTSCQSIPSLQQKNSPSSHALSSGYDKCDDVKQTTSPLVVSTVERNKKVAAAYLSIRLSRGGQAQYQARHLERSKREEKR